MRNRSVTLAPGSMEPRSRETPPPVIAPDSIEAEPLLRTTTVYLVERLYVVQRMRPATGKLITRTIATKIVRPINCSRAQSPERILLRPQRASNTSPETTDAKPV